MVLSLVWGGFLETLNDGILFGFCSGDREEGVFVGSVFGAKKGRLIGVKIGKTEKKQGNREKLKFGIFCEKSGVKWEFHNKISQKSNN